MTKYKRSKYVDGSRPTQYELEQKRMLVYAEHETDTEELLDLVCKDMPEIALAIREARVHNKAVMDTWKENNKDKVNTYNREYQLKKRLNRQNNDLNHTETYIKVDSSTNRD